MDSRFLMPSSQPAKDIVHSFWQTDRSSPFHTELIVPKGIVEVIFNFTEQHPIKAQLSHKQYHLPNCFINGFNTNPIRLSLPKRQCFFGVRFHPTAVKTIFNVPAGEFANLSVDLFLVDASVCSLWHQLAEQKTFEERVSVFSKWIGNRWRQLDLRERLMNRFLEESPQPPLSVTMLSKHLCYSPRHLSRLFLSLTGMNTEEVLSYKRFLLSVELIHFTSLSLTEIAYGCQFADQSHFIKTFKSLAGLTPGEYKKAKSALPGHLFQDVR